MTTTHISMAHAKATFSAMVEGVAHRGERYVIERHGRAAAAVVSPADLDQLLRLAPVGAGAAGAMALVGLWPDLSDDGLAALGASIRASRRRGAEPHVETSP